MSSKQSMVGHRQILESKVIELCDSLAAGAKSLSECSKRLRRGRSLAVISQQLAEVTGAVSVFTKLNEDAQRLARECAEAAERSFLEVESQLRELCAKTGLRIDGQWPDFIVDYGVSVH